MSALQAQTLLASVDRTAIQSNETLTLTISLDRRADTNALDLTALKQEWEVLSFSPQQSISIINGASSAKTVWSLLLAPKEEGQRVIPSFRVDGLISDAIEITVHPAGSNASDLSVSNPLIVDMELSSTSARINEQVLITVRLEAAAGVSNLSGEELSLSAADLVLLDRTNFVKVENGLQVQVVEWRYALFGQQPGVITLPAQLFTASYQFKRIATRTQETSITITPPATDSIHPIWLNANQLSLSRQWNGDIHAIRVGEPITRTITIHAEGQRAAMLPEIRQPQGDFKSYADQPQLNESATSQGIVSSRSESIAIVAAREGELTLPEIRLPWWDNKTEQWQEAILPSETIMVLPSEIQTRPIASPPMETEMGIAENDPLPTEPTGSWLHSPFWFWISALLASLVLGLTFLWWQARCKLLAANAIPRSEKKSKPSLERIRKAAKTGNPVELRTELIRWAQSFWEDAKITSLQDIGNRATSSASDAEVAHELINALNQLNQQLYGASGGAFQAERLLDCLTSLSTTTKHSKKESSLPNLYPTPP